MRFIHTTSHSFPTLDSSYVVSRLGGHIVRNFIANFTYIENVMMDTFISDEKIWIEIKDLTNRIYSERDTIRKLKLRKDRAQKFFLFMKTKYDELYDESLRRGLPKEWCAHPLRAMENEFENNLKRALASAERNYGVQPPAPSSRVNPST